MDLTTVALARRTSALNHGERVASSPPCTPWHRPLLPPAIRRAPAGAASRSCFANSRTEYTPSVRARLGRRDG